MKTKNISRKIERKNARIVIGGAIIFILIVVVIGIVRFRNAFDFTKELNEVAYTFKKEEVLLSEVAYYIMIEEETVNDVALEYDPEKPKT